MRYRTLLAASLFPAFAWTMVVADPVTPPATQPSTQPAGGVATLAGFLTGHFSSAAQAKADADYFDIHLHSCPIWQDRTDGPWLYVEQARGDKLETPYRQRVYHITQAADGSVASAVFELPGTMQEVVKKYAGAWKDVSKLAGVTPQQLKSRDGCTVYLKPKGQALVGETMGKGCSSSLGGAAYATSEVYADASGLKTWDRGYDADGNQVWGAEKGPYRFDRLTD